jgi:hypothetical protein
MMVPAAAGHFKEVTEASLGDPGDAVAPFGPLPLLQTGE